MSALTPQMSKLVERNIDLVRLAVNSTVSRTSRRADWHEYEEMSSEASKALVESAVRWPSYCAGRGEDVNTVANHYFRIFATLRMKGAIIDMWRRESPLTRSEIDYSTYAQRNGAEAAARKFNVSLEAIQQALERRELLLFNGSLSETIEAPESNPLWDVLQREIAPLPPIVKVWMALVFVHCVPVMEARKMLGLTSSKAANQLQGFLEYTLIHAVLIEREAISAAA